MRYIITTSSASHNRLVVARVTGNQTPVLIYAAIGAFGLLFLLGMLFVGDFAGHDLDHGADHDADLGGPGFFSARIMAGFITAFGVGGVVGRYYQLSHPAASGVGVLSGIVMSALIYQFARMLYAQQASSEIRMASLVGRSAEVTVGIPRDGVGQVTLTAGGERSSHIARSADGDAIAAGTDVVVEELRGESLVVGRAKVSR
jgi:membrane protein implicated in regulation of membrane protease activity